MTNRSDQNRSGRGETGDVRPTEHAAVDPAAAAKQDQVRADHRALEESARRVESSVSSEVRNTPIQQADPGSAARESHGSSGGRGEVRIAAPEHAVTDPVGAAVQNQVRTDHDALEESARRVESSVTADVRNTPIQHANDAGRDASNTAGTTEDRPRAGLRPVAVDSAAAARMDRVKEDHDALEESARRVESSVPSDVRNTPVQPVDRNGSRKDR